MVLSHSAHHRCFPRERLRRVLRKKHLQNYFSSTSSHLHLCTSTFSPISLLIFTSSHIYMFTSSHLHIYIITAHLHFLIFTSGHLHLIFTSSHLHISHLHLSLFTFSLKAGGSAAGAKRNATLCGDRACPGREMQAEIAFEFGAGNPLRACREREMQVRLRFGPKSAPRGSQSVAPATKSAHGRSQSAAPATKSGHGGSQSAFPATKSALQETSENSNPNGGTIPTS